jgi:aromatic-L-amino-acid decarboxylase
MAPRRRCLAGRSLFLPGVSRTLSRAGNKQVRRLPLRQLPQGIDKPSSFTSAIAEGVMQWGLVSLDCSGFWVRDRTNLTEALDVTPPFLRSTRVTMLVRNCSCFPGPGMDDERLLGSVVDYRNWSLALGQKVPLIEALVRSEKFRSRRLPSPHQKGNPRSHIPLFFTLHGWPQSISLGEIFAESVRSHPELLELVTPPSFSLSVFRIAPSAVPGISEDELNELNRHCITESYTSGKT